MPTYTYECQKCGNTFELFQSINDPPKATCACGEKKKVKRLITGGAGFIFKGSGFYTTDYRSEDYKKKAAKETESTTKSAVSETKKSESKSDTKTTNPDKKSTPEKAA